MHILRDKDKYIKPHLHIEACYQLDIAGIHRKRIKEWKLKTG